MGIRYAHIRKYFFSLILVLSIVIIGVLSSFRFIVNQDYLVSYEGVCDPKIESCFAGCEDDKCTDKYYYSKVLKYAADLYQECGNDITNCEAASICLPNNRECFITYCDATKGDTCETIISVPDIQKDDLDHIEEESLQGEINIEIL